MHEHYRNMRKSPPHSEGSGLRTGQHFLRRCHFCGQNPPSAWEYRESYGRGPAWLVYIYILLDKPLSFLSWSSFLHPGHLICYIILELITLMLAGLHYTHQVGQCWLNKTLLIPTCIWLPSNYRLCWLGHDPTCWLRACSARLKPTRRPTRWPCVP